MVEQKEILKICMSKGFLLDKEVLEIFSYFSEDKAKLLVDVISTLNFKERIINKNFLSNNFDKLKGFLEEGFEFLNSGSGNDTISQNDSSLEIEKTGKVRLLAAPAFTQKQISVKDFVNHFRSRYEILKNILMQKNLDDLTSIRKLSGGRGTYTIIVSVLDKRVTKNKNLFLTVEDMTGTSCVLINANKKEIFEKAKDLLVDDIVAFNVSGTKEMLFANDVIFPDTSLEEKRSSNSEDIIAFCSDLHIGSVMFLEKNLLKFIKWLNGEVGDETQRKFAKKVSYLLLTGDSIDGVGIFPGQEKFLKIDDAKRQYAKLAEILKLIRKDVKIIIAPGQHDAVWVGEPQPIIGEEWAKELYELENVTLVPNPAFVELDNGFKILMYHGASMHGIIEEIPELRLNYGHDSPTRVVKEMLKRRHLAPMHGLTDYIPCEKDPMVINPVPDIIATGDQHRPEVSIHNNILLIASSCWQLITPFEEKVGNNPDPCKVPVFNTKTREIKILDFSDMGDEVCEIKDGQVVCKVVLGGKNE